MNERHIKRFGFAFLGTLILFLSLGVIGCAPSTDVEPAAQPNSDRNLEVQESSQLLQAQSGGFSFNSGSTGADGPLILTTPGVFDFFAAYGADSDKIYHFTTIQISAGVTVDLSGYLQPPIHWLASGDVQIDGVIDIDGERGNFVSESLPGAGGFMGGRGFSSGSPTTNGSGPGRGERSSTGAAAGAGHAASGESTGYSAAGGSIYGNQFCLPLIGGSGGGGAYQSPNGAGGGAGGGAILIASSTQIDVGGTILANGGRARGVSGAGDGGSGSGGCIRLIAPVINGNGDIQAKGGEKVGEGGAGSRGRIRLEAFDHNFTGTSNPAIVLSTPGTIFIPSENAPIQITSIGGTAVPTTTVGGYNPADVVINASGPITIEVKASGIPVGVTPTIELTAESGETIVATNVTALTGTVLESTATAEITIPSGFSQFIVRADWTP